jgi:hypothetical protein
VKEIPIKNLMTPNVDLLPMATPLRQVINTI